MTPPLLPHTTPRGPVVRRRQCLPGAAGVLLLGSVWHSLSSTEWGGPGFRRITYLYGTPLCVPTRVFGTGRGYLVFPRRLPTVSSRTETIKLKTQTRSTEVKGKRTQFRHLQQSSTEADSFDSGV